MTTVLTEAVKAFIIVNNETMTVREMAKAVNVFDDTIRKFLKQQGLQTLYKRQTTHSNKPLQLHHKKFIKDNCANMTTSELSRAVENTWHIVSKFLKENGLTAKRGKTIDAPFPQHYNVVKQKFERPPAEYSNKQWT